MSVRPSTKKKSIFEDDDDDNNNSSGNVDSLKVNEDFAAQFEKRKKFQELNALKLKYGDNLNEGSEDEDSSETEDEDAVLDTPDKDVKFLQLLPLINKQVPQINTLSEPIFKPEDDADDDGDDNNAKATVAADDDKPRRREKAIRLNDYIRQQLLEHGPEAMLDADDDRKRPRSEVAASKTLTYVGEQDELKKNFLSAFDEALEPNDDDAEKKIGGVLQIRSTAKPLKTLRKIENVDSTIPGVDSSAVSDLLRTYWQTEQIDEKDKFLRDYIVNRRWKDELANHIPTYKEITAADEDDEDEDASVVDGEDQMSIAKKFDLVDEEDESELDRQDQFEERYNFRYEEPGGDTIATYPRPSTILGVDAEASARRRDSRRVEARRLKTLLRSQLAEKLDHLRKIAGLSAVVEQSAVASKSKPKHRDDDADNVENDATNASTKRRSSDDDVDDKVRATDVDDVDESKSKKSKRKRDDDDDDDEQVGDDDNDKKKKKKKSSKNDEDDDVDNQSTSSKKKSKKHKRDSNDDDNDENKPNDFTIKDLEGAFDPEAHDRRMRELFGDEFYGELQPDAVKPVFDDDDDDEELRRVLKEYAAMDNSTSNIDDVLDRIKQHRDADEDDDNDDKAPNDDDDEKDNDDDDDKEQAVDDEALAEQLEVDKAALARARAKLEDDLHRDLKDYYDLDYDDVIAGDLKTRFKYTSVPAMDFGLTPLEILTNSDESLNQLVGLKRLAPYKDQRLLKKTNWKWKKQQWEREMQMKRQDAAKDRKSEKKDREAKRALKAKKKKERKQVKKNAAAIV